MGLPSVASFGHGRFMRCSGGPAITSLAGCLALTLTSCERAEPPAPTYAQQPQALKAPPPAPEPTPEPPVLEAFFPARRPNFGPAPSDGGPLQAAPSKLLAGVRGPELPTDGGRLDDEWILAQTPKRWRVTASAPTVLKDVALVGPDGLPWPTQSSLERRGAQSVAELQVTSPLATGRSYVLIVTTQHTTWRLPVSVASGVDVAPPW